MDADAAGRVNDNAAAAPERMEEIISANESALLRYAGWLVGDPHAAQDIVQEAFIKLVAHIGSRDFDAAAVRYWLFRVVHNLAVDYMRSQARRAELLRRQAEDIETFHSSSAEAEAGAALEERRAQVQRLLKRLTPAERQVLLLRMQQGLSYEEISRITGRTVGNVGCLLHNAVKRLAKLMKTAGGGFA